MELLLQLIITGIVSGSIYLLFGISFSIILAVTRTFHFAHGATFVVGAYSAYFLQQLGTPLFLAAFGGVLGAVFFGLAIEGILYRFLRKSQATALVIFIASLGVLITAENLISMGFGTDVKTLEGFPLRVFKDGGITINSLQIVMLMIAGSLFLGLMIYLHRTRSGKALRALISNPEMAEVIGIDNQQMFLLAFAIGSFLIGSAAVLVTLERGATPVMGHWAIFYCMTAMIIGGIGRLEGAALGGLIIGLTESIGIWKIPSQWQIGIAFTILFFVLIFKPTGLFGVRVYRGKI